MGYGYNKLLLHIVQTLLESKEEKKEMAPPGIEPGLTQIETTTMCRHTTRPWHLFNIKNELVEE